MQFERAWAAGSWTRPSVPSLLTGLYPSEHGLDDSFHASSGTVAARRLSPAAETIAEVLSAKGYRTALFAHQPQFVRAFRLGQGFARYEPHLGHARFITKQFRRWLESSNAAPFFAYLHYFELHWPYCPRTTFGALDSDPGTRNFCAGSREVRRRMTRGDEILSARDRRALRARYAEQLLELDAELGRLFEQLKAAGRWDETLIVVTSDHGEELYDHGATRHAHTLYEELVHVPFVWKLPMSWRAPGGRRLGGLVETRSLAPTLFEAVGASIPERISAPSLVPWLVGREATRAPTEFAFAESSGLVAVRGERFKLIVNTRKKSIELFDLVADPAEAHDLAASEPDRVAALQRQLRVWRNGLQPLPPEAGVEVDAESVEELRALGYVQ